MSNYISLVLLSSMMGFFLACNQGTIEGDTAHIPINLATHCTTCHGQDLKGDIAQSLLDGSWQFGSRRHDIVRSIKFGHPHHGMPSWQGVLADQEIDSMVAFLLREEERLGIAKPALPSELETQDYRVQIEVFCEGLDIPWSMEFLEPDRVVVTERAGDLRIIENGNLHPNPVKGTPPVRHLGQGGLMEVAKDPNYAENGWLYLSISHGLPAEDTSKPAPAMTSIVRGRLDGMTWIDNEVIFEAAHESYRTAAQHFGGRIAFDPDGFLYFSIGDRGAKEHAQDLSKPNGKIHRIYPDGSIPTSNPFYQVPKAIKSIYSYGHRNPQGLAVHHQTGRIWSTEHGPLGGDELNHISKGANYGWPVISYGINYNGTVMTDLQRKKGMEQPNLYWKPSIAVCGLQFYYGAQFPKWNNKLLVGSLKFEELQLLDIEADRVIYQQTILKNGGRVRDIKMGPQGGIFLVLNRPGRIIRLSSKNPS